MTESYFDTLKGKLNLSLRRKVPQILQTEASECGLASLAMVCHYHGLQIDLFNLRSRYGFSSRGATLSALIDIASALKLQSRALSLNIDELKALKMPCILHWDMKHFVVLVSVSRGRAVIHDPAFGRKVLGLHELSRHFTGVALELWPDSEFQPIKQQSRLRFRKLMSNVRGLKGALLKIFCLSIVIETVNLLLPVGTQLVMDHVILAGDHDLLALICIGLLFFILFRTGVSMLRSWISIVMGALIDVQWKAGVFDHLMKLPLSFFEKRKLGDIQSRFGSLDTLRSTFTTSIVGAIMDGIMVIGVLVMMVLYGGWLTWVVIAFTAIYVLMRLLTYGYYRQLSEEALVREARAGSYFMETLYGIATVKMQGMAERRIAHWLNLEIDTINTGIRVTRMDMLFGGINTFIAACDQVVILWLGASLVIDNQMTLGMFVAFGAFRGQFSDRIGSLTEFLLQLRMMSLHNERIADIALHPRENRKPDLPYAAGLQPLGLTTHALSYRYDSQSPAVFDALDISVAPGESVAIVGPSGAGKTTLMKVLCGLFPPDSGRVEVNGVDIRQLGINNYHKMIACVMQDDKLFSGSIRENICGFADEVDDAWMEACARASYLHDVLMRMPMGYETPIGELGEGLSGGQKQRLFIARAIYKKPAILFLDEATSALDKESEAVVNQAIKRLNITKVIIAHRETTIASADRVIHFG
ncbi:peptidase domain-containing ABC transporter [Serratia marcescens]|uniref:peptidase domain-containing ABC transporter n=1 Tax=Serratia marcescens TaxID=615 RepID=UPI003F81A5AD